jgi:hypothetical protein
MPTKENLEDWEFGDSEDLQDEEYMMVPDPTKVTPENSVAHAPVQPSPNSSTVPSRNTVSQRLASRNQNARLQTASQESVVEKPNEKIIPENAVDHAPTQPSPNSSTVPSSNTVKQYVASRLQELRLQTASPESVVKESTEETEPFVYLRSRQSSTPSTSEVAKGTMKVSNETVKKEPIEKKELSVPSIFGPSTKGVFTHLRTSRTSSSSFFY